MVRRVDRRRLLTAVVAGTAGLAGCLDGVFGSTITEPFSETHDAIPGATLTVDNRNGDVTVTAHDGDEVTIEGERRASTRNALEELSVEVSPGEPFAVVGSLGDASSLASPAIELEVGVPDGMEVGAVETRNGAVTVTGVAGDVSATTRNGAVRVTDVDGFVRGESNNGNVELRETAGLAGANTANGSIDVELRAMRDDVTCRTRNGNVTIAVADDLSADLDLHTSNGRVHVEDLPYQATVERATRVEGQLRGGGTWRLTGESTNGTVRLRPIGSGG